MTNASSQSRPGAKKGVGCRCESERAHSVQWVGVGTAPERTIRVNTSGFFYTLELKAADCETHLTGLKLDYYCELNRLFKLKGTYCSKF